MEGKDGKMKELLNFLDKNAFDPIINMREDQFSDDDLKRKFRDVKRSTQSEKERFHTRYQSAEEIKRNYMSDLYSRTAMKKNAELSELGLPRLPQYHDEFLRLCEKLGI